MANTLTGLIPVMYKGMDIIARELVGLIPAVDIDASMNSAAVGETINTPVIPAASGSAITPGQVPPDEGDQTVSTLALSISKAYESPIRWTGEEIQGYRNNGTFEDTLAKQFAQSVRYLVNLVEADLAALYAGASRAYGTAGTTPFGTAGDLSDIANIRKLLEDNGAPCSDLQLVLGTAEGVNIAGKQSVLFKVSEAGTDDLLRRGTIGELEGFAVHKSAQRKSVTAGTGASATTNTAGYAVGATSITLAAVGTGTILAGDVITFAGDTNKYVVAVGCAAVSGATITLAKPGLQQAIAASAIAITVGSAFKANMAFERQAIKLLARAPAMPDGGDSADDVTYITDPISGLTFQVCLYRLYRRVKYEVGLAWGTAVVKPDFLHILLG